MGACLACFEQPTPPPITAQFSNIQTTSSGALALQQALFFPDDALPCRHYLRGDKCRRRNCTYAHTATSLVRLIGELRAATSSLDVCVFTITCNEIADEVAAAAARGVKVRIITDDSQATSQGSDVNRLSQCKGIEVRHDGDQAAHMHHKFAIVDGVTLLNGSFNWTRAAVTTNRENVVVTKQAPELLASFTAVFELMWREFSKNTAIPSPGDKTIW